MAMLLKSSLKYLSSKCILGRKASIFLLISKEGTCFPLQPTDGYPIGLKGFWVLEKVGKLWHICRFLKKDYSYNDE